jgi:ParB/RepB/Spo0J family partition protein
MPPSNETRHAGGAAGPEVVCFGGEHLPGSQTKNYHGSRLLPIDSIKIGPRFRQDHGDIGELARSIAGIGLLHPIVVSQHGQLLAGRRRLEACKSLRWETIPVTVMEVRDAPDA